MSECQEILQKNIKGDVRTMKCRMRSIRETAEIFHQMDPDTQITEKTLRIMIANGTIPAVKTGVKYLINVDLLIEMFCSYPENGYTKVGED